MWWEDGTSEPWSAFERNALSKYEYVGQPRRALCEVCGQHLDPDGECDICSVALREGKLVEEVRLEVEDLAHSMAARFASAAGKPCTCGVGSGGSPIVVSAGQKRGLLHIGMIDWEVRHEAGCPRAPGAFDWADVDEEARRRVFGYDGRTVLAARLVGVLRQELHEREVLDR
jgi:hypothetical protein